MRQILSYLYEMTTGPGHLRFLMQPAIAIFFGIRDGRRDAHLGRRAIGAELGSRRGAERWHHLRRGLRPVLVALCMAIGLSLLYQYWIHHRLRLVPALIAAVILVALPYLLARGFSNRIDVRWHRSHPRKASV